MLRKLAEKEVGEQLGKDLTGVIEKISSTETKSESASFSNKDRLAQVAVARMRGYILNESNDFRYASNLTPKQVVQEFYRRGGSNAAVSTKKTQDDHALDHWKLLAGLK